MENAIKKAIEGGYEKLHMKHTEFLSIEIDNDRVHYNFYDLQCSQTDHFTYSKNAILLDPLFWKALGKSVGWKDVERYDKEGGFSSIKGWIRIEGWVNNWHHFINHLAEGEDAESFFNELIK